uniref:Uncharacterized protein n=1 Tax=Ailuropoda melanoleuca TaxID=9646 RepID=A0A7N5JKV0_AILME
CQRTVGTRKTKTEVAENLTLVLEESQGKQTGVITPRRLFGSWRRLSPPLSHLAVAPWGRIESEGIPPSSKQSSVTKTESCQPRCKPTERSGEWEADTEKDGGDMGRVDTSPSGGGCRKLTLLVLQTGT